MCADTLTAGFKWIVYYECENLACGLRFPDLRDRLNRERCPMCRARIRIAQEHAQPEQEFKLNHPRASDPLIEVLVDNIRSGWNVGSIFRTADGVGVRKIYLGGITPTPDNPVLHKTALGAENTVPWEHINNGVTKARQLKQNGYILLGLEASGEADSLYSQGEKIGSSPLLMVIGNEVCGVDPAIVELCERIVSIPMFGVKRSFNVSIAFGIAASYLHHCQIRSQGSESMLPNTRLIP